MPLTFNQNSIKAATCWNVMSSYVVLKILTMRLVDNLYRVLVMGINRYIILIEDDMVVERLRWFGHVKTDKVFFYRI